MAISERPISIKNYYQLMKEQTNKKLDEALKLKDNLSIQLNKRHKELTQCSDIYKNNFKIDLNKYKEFVDNQYKTGEFYKIAKGLFINRSNNYTLVSDLFDLYNYAKVQKQIYDLNNQINLYNKLLELTISKYTEILRIYYTEVHKKIVLNGDGYSFAGNIGWICVNRIVRTNPKPTIDYAATRKREAELKAQGKRIYNKEEAEWCLKNGIEYHAEDKRVFLKDEYYYEIPLIGCKLPNATKLKFTIADYRHVDLRGFTNEDIINNSNNDTKKICELGIDLKTKVTLCDKADKILYTKYIRNENQKSIASSKISGKNR